MVLEIGIEIGIVIEDLDPDFDPDPDFDFDRCGQQWLISSPVYRSSHFLVKLGNTGNGIWVYTCGCRRY
jgi:hypothetical protein